jgi:hypothetical protein
MKSTMVRIDMIIYKPLKIEAEKDGQTIQSWVSDLIREELKRRKLEIREASLQHPFIHSPEDLPGKDSVA